MIKNEPLIRLIFFIGIFTIVALWELFFPRRALLHSKLKRWGANLFVIISNGLLVRFLLPLLPVSLAIYLQENAIGVLNLVEISFLAKALIGFIILDFAIYLQHLVFHAVPLLWRIHMFHHADPDIDLTTGLRFHLIEIVLSIFIKLALVYVIGPPIISVIIFEIVLNGAAMFNHGNIKLPPIVDKYLRLIIVTPDMHRVHHSVIIRETNSNFGFNLPWWDRIFGTYRSAPIRGHEKMTIGLSQYQHKKYLNLFWMLIIPFVGEMGPYAINSMGGNPDKTRIDKEKTCK